MSLKQDEFEPLSSDVSKVCQPTHNSLFVRQSSGVRLAHIERGYHLSCSDLKHTQQLEISLALHFASPARPQNFYLFLSLNFAHVQPVYIFSCNFLSARKGNSTALAVGEASVLCLVYHF